MPVETTDGTAQHKALQEQVRLLFGNVLLANLAVILTSLICVSILINAVPRTPLLVWLAFMVAASGLRLFLLHQYRQLGDSIPTRLWARRYTLGTLLVGVLWSGLAVFMFLYDDLIVHATVLIVLVGAMTVSVSALHSYLPAFYACGAPMLLGLLISLSLQPSLVNMLLLLTVMVFAAMNTRTAVGTNRYLRNSLLLKYKHDSLISELHEENVERERAEKELKAHGELLGKLVDERTEQLVTINHSLENEIGERRRAEDNLKHLAHHDPLTGLPNRLLLNARLEHAIERVHRSGNLVAVLFMDLDKFKNINDSLGHAAGDELLRKVAERLREGIREDDTVARLGGDEFVVVMEQVANMDVIELLANKLMSAFDQKMEIKGQAVFIGTSIGISVFPKDGDCPEQLISNADAAMYRAKEEGRRNHQFYTRELTETSYDRVILESGLRHALEAGELLLYYQPQVSLHSRKVVGVEALIRWQHPQLGLLEPDVFMSVAEDSGLIVLIGRWVMEQGCRQMAEWKRQGLTLEHMAINLAGRQCSDLSLVNTVANILETTGCEAEWLELEITESFIMTETGHSVDTLDQLKQLGVSMAIDDFGTGYSSLSYLKTLPVDRLKIDRSFIRDLATDRNDVAIVKAIMALGKALQLELTAEGVETAEQEYFLRQHGCNQGQGFWFGPPVPAEEISRKLSGQVDGKQNQA